MNGVLYISLRERRGADWMPRTWHASVPAAQAYVDSVCSELTVDDIENFEVELFTRGGRTFKSLFMPRCDGKWPSPKHPNGDLSEWLLWRVKAQAEDPTGVPGWDPRMVEACRAVAQGVLSELEGGRIL